MSNKFDANRALFKSKSFPQKMLFSGTPKINLNLSILNRHAANITVVIVEYTKNGDAKEITRGWMDPQNYQDLSHGELLTRGQSYSISFELEPKQYKIDSGSSIGVVLMSTDYNYTIRPLPGTEIEFIFDQDSKVEFNLSQI